MKSESEVREKRQELLLKEPFDHKDQGFLWALTWVLEEE